MERQSESLIEVVSKFSSFLQSLSKKDIEDIAKGDKIVRFSIVSKEIITSDTTPNSEVNVDEIASKLRSFDTREEGELLLNDLSLKRVDYERLIRFLDLPFNKKDNLAKMKEKVLEGTIGYRLRSRAVTYQPLF